MFRVFQFPIKLPYEISAVINREYGYLPRLSMFGTGAETTLFRSRPLFIGTLLAVVLPLCVIACLCANLFLSATSSGEQTLSYVSFFKVLALLPMLLLSCLFLWMFVALTIVGAAILLLLLL